MDGTGGGCCPAEDPEESLTTEPLTMMDTAELRFLELTTDSRTATGQPTD